MKSNKDKDEKQKNISDRQISFKFETPKTSPKIVTEFKLFDQQLIDINQKIKMNTEIPLSSNTVPELQSELDSFS